MTYKGQAQPIFSTATYGLKRVFSAISGDTGAGVTLGDFSDKTKTGNVSSYDTIFAQMMQQNIQKYDANHDGVLSESELNTMITEMSEDGLTEDQLVALASQNGMGIKQETIEKILSNFKKIDQNNDGKVSSAELDTYFINDEMESKKEEFSKVKLTDYTCFYTDSTIETDSDDDDTSSD